MIDYIAIIDCEQVYTNSEDFQSVTIDSKLEVICCLLELLNCLALECVWLAGIETFTGLHSILTAINTQT